MQRRLDFRLLEAETEYEMFKTYEKTILNYKDRIKWQKQAYLTKFSKKYISNISVCYALFVKII